MHRNVVEFTSSTLVISHVIVCYPLLIPMSETILLSTSQTKFIYYLKYKWNFAQSYFSMFKINRTQPAKQLIEYNLIIPATNLPKILTHISLWQVIYRCIQKTIRIKFSFKKISVFYSSKYSFLGIRWTLL